MGLLAKKSYGIQKSSFNGAIEINPCPISQHISMQAMKQGFSLGLVILIKATQVIIGLSLLIISYVNYSKSTL